MSSSGCSEQLLHPLFYFCLISYEDKTQQKGVDEKYDCGEDSKSKQDSGGKER